MVFGSLIGVAGLPLAMVRLLGEGLARRNREWLRATLTGGLQILTAASLAVSLSALFWLAAGGGRWLRLDVSLEWRIGFTAALLLLAWQCVLVEVIRGLGELRWASLFGGGQSAGPLATLIFAASLVTTVGFRPPTAAAALDNYAVSLALTMPAILLALWVAWRRATAPLLQTAAGDRVPPLAGKTILLTSLPICISQLLSYFALAVDLPIAASFCSASEAALLGQARRLLMLLQLPGQIAVLAVLPSVARLYYEGRLDELERLVRKAATLWTLAAVPVAVVFLVIPGAVMSLLFGEFYRHGAPLLVALTLGQLVAIHNGIAGYVLLVTGRHKAVVYTNALTAGLMLILGPLAATWGGVLWLSVVSACVLTVQSALEWWLARRFLNTWTHLDWNVLPPLIFGTSRKPSASPPLHPSENLPDLRFSLVVSTIGRDRELRQLLTSLVAQTCQDFEVIVVDQSQGRSLAAVIDEFRDRLSILHLLVNQRGAARGRNFGWSYARGAVLNFPDDDCTWPPGLLAAVKARLSARPALDALIARVDTMTNKQIKGGPVNRHNVLQLCVEFAAFFRRSRMGDLRFDEQMGPGAGTPWGADEGPDLMLRMLERGLTIEYDPELCLCHPDPMAIPPDKLLARALAYSGGRGYLLRKHCYPWFIVGSSLAQSLGISFLNLLMGRWTRARLHWLSFWGKCVGYHASQVAARDAAPLHTDFIR